MHEWQQSSRHLNMGIMRTIYLQEVLLIGKLQWLLWWNIVLFIQIYGKLSKLLQASEKPCHGFVKSGAPEQIYRAKPEHQQCVLYKGTFNLAKARRLKKYVCQQKALQFICIVVDVGDSWIASHRVNLDPVSRRMFRNSIGYFDLFITIVCLVLTLRLMHFIKF